MTDNEFRETEILRRWTLTRRPRNAPTTKDFHLETADLPTPGQDEVLIRTVYISLDPHTRAEIGDLASGLSSESQAQTLPQLPLGQTIPGYCVGEVVESRSTALKPGDMVRGYWGWQTYAIGIYGGADHGRPVASDSQVQAGQNTVFRIDPDVVPASRVMHMLGEMGLTAYVGLTAVGRPKPGDVVFVSSAAGTVGGIAGQTAKNLGCRVVGSVGSQAKARYITEELGFDGAVIHSAADVEAQLDAACPDGIDIYFDNVGGHFSDLIMARLRPRSRVVLCGATADWNAGGSSVGPRQYWPIIVHRATVEGFVLWDRPEEYEAGYKQLFAWSRAGLLRNAEHIIDGFDNVPQAFIDFLAGRFHGKALVQVAPDPTRPSNARSKETTS